MPPRSTTTLVGTATPSLTFYRLQRLARSPLRSLRSGKRRRSFSTIVLLFVGSSTLTPAKRTPHLSNSSCFLA
jgi:hypothetical protein